MSYKTFFLCASTTKDKIIDHIPRKDPFDRGIYSEIKPIGAKDEAEAISIFQESSEYYRFCEANRNVYTFLKGEDGLYRRTDTSYSEGNTD